MTLRDYLERLSPRAVAPTIVNARYQPSRAEREAAEVAAERICPVFLLEGPKGSNQAPCYVAFNHQGPHSQG